MVAFPQEGEQFGRYVIERVLRLVDDTHATLTQDPLDHVATELFAFLGERNHL